MPIHEVSIQTVSSFRKNPQAWDFIKQESSTDGKKIFISNDNTPSFLRFLKVVESNASFFKFFKYPCNLNKVLQGSQKITFIVIAHHQYNAVAQKLLNTCNASQVFILNTNEFIETIKLGKITEYKFKKNPKIATKKKQKAT